MSEPQDHEYREAGRPFTLPEDFDDKRVLFHTEPATPDARRPGDLSASRLRWKLVGKDDETLRSGDLVVRGTFAGGDRLPDDVAGFAAWYSAVRDITEQNELRFHPPSEIPLTLTYPGGEVVETPPQFFTS